MTQQADGADPLLRTEDAARRARSSPASARRPRPATRCCSGSTTPAPSCAVALRLRLRRRGRRRRPDAPAAGVGGVGRRPAGRRARSTATRPAGSTGRRRRPARPATAHRRRVVSRLRAGWLRCRVVEPRSRATRSTAPPRRSAARRPSPSAGPSTASTPRRSATRSLGLSEGVPGQTFPLAARAGRRRRTAARRRGRRRPGLGDVDRGRHVRRLRRPSDQVLPRRPVNGEVRVRAAVREPDGTLRCYGAVPPKGAPIRVPRYRTGGGPRGNVAARRVSRAAHVDPVRRPGREPACRRRRRRGETIEEAKVRGPLALRTRDRAVTAEDYEQLAREAAPDIARVRCVPAADGRGRRRRPGAGRALRRGRRARPAAVRGPGALARRRSRRSSALPRRAPDCSGPGCWSSRRSTRASRSWPS